MVYCSDSCGRSSRPSRRRCSPCGGKHDPDRQHEPEHGSNPRRSPIPTRPTHVLCSTVHGVPSVVGRVQGHPCVSPSHQRHTHGSQATTCPQMRHRLAWCACDDGVRETPMLGDDRERDRARAWCPDSVTQSSACLRGAVTPHSDPGPTVHSAGQLRMTGRNGCIVGLPSVGAMTSTLDRGERCGSNKERGSASASRPSPAI